ncbi:MAG: hypothetical protein EAX96_01010 [Candidatus Lokiarchaeota archaeon]|nr:hypothetical protein [Candidatus Lokiarchaeota archaeon]
MLRISSDRKTIAINKEIAQKINEIAKKRGKTTYAFLNEILEAAILAEDLDLDCKEVIKTSYNIQVIRDADLSYVPRSLYNLLMELVYPEQKSMIIEKTLEFGKWLGSYSKVRFAGKELDTVINILDSLYSRTEEKYNINIKNDKELIFQRYTLFPNVNRLDSETYIYEGLFSEFGYKLKSRKVTESDYELIFYK